VHAKYVFTYEPSVVGSFCNMYMLMQDFVVGNVIIIRISRFNLFRA